MLLFFTGIHIFFGEFGSTEDISLGFSPDGRKELVEHVLSEGALVGSRSVLLYDHSYDLDIGFVGRLKYREVLLHNARWGTEIKASFLNNDMVNINGETYPYPPY